MKENVFFSHISKLGSRSLARLGKYLDQGEKIGQGYLAVSYRFAHSVKNALLEYLQYHKGKTVLIMLLILIAGTVGSILRRSNMKDNEEVIAGETFFRRTKDVVKRVAKPIVSGVSEQSEVLLLESKLSQILSKEVLTQEDSIFLLQLDKYLDRISLYKELPAEDSTTEK